MIKVERVIELLTDIACEEALERLGSYSSVKKLWEATTYLDLQWIINELTWSNNKQLATYWERARLAAVISIFEDHLPPSKDLNRYILEANKYITGKKAMFDGPADFELEFKDMKKSLGPWGDGCDMPNCWYCCDGMGTSESRAKSIRAVVRCPTERELRTLISG